MQAWLITAVLRVLRIPCGAYGGGMEGDMVKARWCWKSFGHSDSHAYDLGVIQPLHNLRCRAQGWQ